MAILVAGAPVFSLTRAPLGSPARSAAEVRRFARSRSALGIPPRGVEVPTPNQSTQLPAHCASASVACQCPGEMTCRGLHLVDSPILIPPGILYHSPHQANILRSLPLGPARREQRGERFRNFPPQILSRWRRETPDNPGTQAAASSLQLSAPPRSVFSQFGPGRTPDGLTSFRAPCLRRSGLRSILSPFAGQRSANSKKHFAARLAHGWPPVGAPPSLPKPGGKAVRRPPFQKGQETLPRVALCAQTRRFVNGFVYASHQGVFP